MPALHVLRVTYIKISSQFSPFPKKKETEVYDITILSVYATPYPANTVISILFKVAVHLVMDVCLRSKQR
jgi:hypothetical protein